MTVVEVALIQVSFPSVGSKQKIKMDTRNTMASSYHSKDRILKTWEFHFSLVWVIEFSIICPCFGKGEA